MPPDLSPFFGGAYRGRKVFVTGHTGFKGGWLVLWLKALGADVCGYSLGIPSTPSFFAGTRLEEGIRHVVGDIRHHEALCTAIQTFAPDIVFHLAAQALVRQGYADPRGTYETNVMGTVNLLDSVRHTPSVSVLVNVTSDKCYENREWPYAYRENDPMGGSDPYSSSKGCSELVTAAYRRSFFHRNTTGERPFGLVTMRAGNVVGGGDWAADRLVPDCVRALAENHPIRVRNPSAVRPWQHVLDPVSAYLWMGAWLWKDPTAFAGAWNIGPPPAGDMTVREIVDTVIGTWGSGTWESSPDPDAPHEAHTLRLDCSKAMNLLQWQSCYSQGEAIQAAVRWYYGYYRQPGFDAREFSLGQIAEFSARARDLRIPWAMPSPGG